MRATYEDLLREARRLAVVVHQTRHTDPVELINGWQSVLNATKVHLSWLRFDLRAGDEVAAEGNTTLDRLARVIGASSDLLASLDLAGAVALDNPEDLVRARTEIAEIAQIAGRAVLRDSELHESAPAYRDTLKALDQLGRIVRAGRHSGRGLGGMSGVATSWPRFGTDHLSTVSWAAARWDRLYQEVEPQAMLTRDLRSLTAQLRTVCGYGWHLADCLTSAHWAADEDNGEHVRELKDELRAFEVGAARVSRSWRERLSDVSGASSEPGEAAFLDLVGALREFVSPDGALLTHGRLVPDVRTGLSVLSALDELVDSAARVARFQQCAVSELILAGGFFVPRRELVKQLPIYLPRPLGLRSVAVRWVRTNAPECFAELIESLAWSTDRLAAAAAVARSLAGTTRQSRPSGDTSPRLRPTMLNAYVFPSEVLEPPIPSR